MLVPRNQRTIADIAVVEGFGYWSGRDVRLEFCPADAGTGIVFVRTDVASLPEIPAYVERHVERPLRSVLGSGEFTVEMVEHVMAALAGLQIDNCRVLVDHSEMPGCDGSSLRFVEALDRAGIVVQDAVKPRLIVDDIIRLGAGDSWVEARPSRNGRSRWSYCVDYGPGNAIGRQSFGFDLSPEAFRRDVAPCRTFMLASEAEWLVSQGISDRAGYADLLVFGDDGPIENTLRFADECARHKLLDMVGDLALCGLELVGEFTGFRSGHRLNGQLTRALVAANGAARNWRRCA